MNVKNVDQIINKNEGHSTIDKMNRETYQFEATNHRLLMKGGYKLDKWA